MTMGKFIYSIICLSLITSACNNIVEDGVTAKDVGSEIKIIVRSNELNGLCYAPKSIVPNASLVLEDMDKSNDVIIRRISRSKVDDFSRIISLPMVKMNSGILELKIKKDYMVLPTSYIQVVAFPCDIAARPMSDRSDLVSLVSISVSR